MEDRRLRLVAAMACVLAWATSSGAKEAARSATAAPESKPQRVWYGEQTLVVDGLSVASLVGGAIAASRKQTTGTDALVWTGGLGYFLGGPIVHRAHGHPGKSWASLGLRVGVPLAGALVGFALLSAGCRSEARCLEGVGPGAILGAVGAIALDATVVAREDVPVRPSQRGGHYSLFLTAYGAGAALSGVF